MAGLISTDLFEIRKLVAQRYLKGVGVEFGALHACLDVPDWVVVKYADMVSADELRKTYPDLKGIRAPDIVTDLESMDAIATGSMDFVIANHVLEHVEDPFRALKSMSRVLTPSGVAFIALPDKRFTFDRDRQITPLDHLIKDHNEGPDWSLAAHYDEWVHCVDGLSGDAFQCKYDIMLANRDNIHFHVWDYTSMLAMFAYATQMPDLDLQVEFSMLNSIEGLWILRKADVTNTDETKADASVNEAQAS